MKKSTILHLIGLCFLLFLVSFCSQEEDSNTPFNPNEDSFSHSGRGRGGDVNPQPSRPQPQPSKRIWSTSKFNPFQELNNTSKTRYGMPIQSKPEEVMKKIAENNPTSTLKQEDKQFMLKCINKIYQEYEQLSTPEEKKNHSPFLLPKNEEDKKNQLEILDKICKEKYEKSFTDPVNGAQYKILYDIAMDANLPLMYYLTQVGAIDLNARSEFGNYVVMHNLAGYSHTAPVMQKMIDLGADVLASNGYGYPMNVAAQMKAGLQKASVEEILFHSPSPINSALSAKRYPPLPFFLNTLKEQKSGPLTEEQKDQLAYSFARQLWDYFIDSHPRSPEKGKKRAFNSTQRYRLLTSLQGLGVSKIRILKLAIIQGFVFNKTARPMLNDLLGTSYQWNNENAILGKIMNEFPDMNETVLRNSYNSLPIFQ